MSYLNTVNVPLKWALLRKDSRVFALLGKATPFGLTAFSRKDVPRGWALTAEFGCLRLERLAGDEEITGGHLVLPTPQTYDYGVTGITASPDLVRAVFGLLPAELDLLVKSLRYGGFPMMGFSHRDLKCSISSCTIPGYWPHIVISNTPLYGNVISLEVFVRSLIASMPHGQLGSRYPQLQSVFKELMRLMLGSRSGIPFNQDLLELAPMTALAMK